MLQHECVKEHSSAVLLNVSNLLFALTTLGLNLSFCVASKSGSLWVLAPTTAADSTGWDFPSLVKLSLAPCCYGTLC
jgi:hypothetical protein